jgi:hypothetical protein
MDKKICKYCRQEMTYYGDDWLCDNRNCDSPNEDYDCLSLDEDLGIYEDN